jgi:hypothetical protein
MVRKIMSNKLNSFMLSILSMCFLWAGDGVLNQSIAGVFSGNQLFVSPAGDDAVTRANNAINNTWLTVEKAMLTAKPGDVVNFRVGTYNIDAPIETRPGSDGTENERIVFTNYQDEVVLFSSLAANKIFIDRKNWTISGINGESNVTLFHIGAGSFGTADNFIIEKGTMTQTEQGGAANVSPLLFQTTGASNAIVRDMKFIGPGKNLNENTAGVFAFRSKGLKVLNNEFTGFPSAIYYKHPGVPNHTGIEIAYNYFHGNKKGIESSAIFAYIHDNLFVDSALLTGQGSGFGDDGNNAGADNSFIIHNTFYNSELELVGLNAGEGFGATNNKVFSNIFTQPVKLIRYKDIDHKNITNYNLYPSVDAVLNNITAYTLRQWQDFYKKDVSSIAGAPVFVNGATPIAIADYTLSTSSPGYKAGSDGTDMGALMSAVGIGNNGLSLSIPNAPGSANIE